MLRLYSMVLFSHTFSHYIMFAEIRLSSHAYYELMSLWRPASRIVHF